LREERHALKRKIIFIFLQVFDGNTVQVPSHLWRGHVSKDLRKVMED